MVFLSFLLGRIFSSSSEKLWKISSNDENETSFESEACILKPWNVRIIDIYSFDRFINPKACVFPSFFAKKHFAGDENWSV